MKKFLLVMAAVLFATVTTSSTKAVKVPNTDGNKTAQMEQLALDQQLATLKSVPWLPFQIPSFIKSVKSQNTTPWVFTSDDPDDILDPNHWQPNITPPDGCGEGVTLPCTIMGPDTRPAFEEFLGEEFENEAAVLTASIGRRDPDPKN